MISCPHQFAAAAAAAASGSAAVELHQNHQNSPAHTNSLAASSCRNAAAAAGSDSAAAAAEFGSAATLTEIAACSAAAENWPWHSHLHSGFAAVVAAPMSEIVAGLVFVHNPIQQWAK